MFFKIFELAIVIRLYDLVKVNCPSLADKSYQISVIVDALRL
jgi:hypothetical protein